MSDFPDMDFYRVANLDIRNDPENEVKPFSSTSNGQNNMSTPNESCVQLNEYGKRVKVSYFRPTADQTIILLDRHSYQSVFQTS